MTDKICDTCCREIPADAPGGLCPVCLLKAGLGDQSPDGRTEKTTPFPSAASQVPTADELAPFFPQFEILSLIGQGGMGAVYHARQTKLDRPVALKIIRPESAADPSFAERFSREARTLARLNHPNIVGIHDFGEFENGYFFVMEYVSGANLRQILSDGRLEQSQALSIVRQICEALQYAHDEGVVHRDIKPENLLVDQAGRIKIADFGLARLNSAAQGADAEKYFTLTGTHQVMGTPRYMAPEQIEASSRVDHRADIYSLGVVFYEMLTGEIPMGSFEPPSQKQAVDNRLDQVVLKAMAREPDRRYQQVSSLAHDVVSIDPASLSSHTGVGGLGRITGHESNPTYPSAMPGADGFTAIFDRDIKAVVPWVAGAFNPSEATKKHRAPILFLIGLALIGCLATAFPWVKYTVEPLTESQVAAAIGDSLKPGEVAANITGVIIDQGVTRLPGVIALFGLAVIALVLIVIPVKRQMPMSLAIGTTLLSVIVLIGLAIFPTFSSRFAKHEATGIYEHVMGKDFRPDIIDTKFQTGFYVCLGCGIGSLLLSVVGLRHSIEARESQATLNKSTTASAEGRLLGGPDWVTITQKDIDEGTIPNLCIICGDPTESCVNRSFTWQPKFLQEMSKGSTPWSALSKREFRMPCPVCEKHRNHWTKFVLLCSTGWIPSLVLGGVGTAIADQIDPGNDGLIAFCVISGFFGPLAIYIAMMIRMGLRQLETIRIEKDSITLNRVSWKFAKAFSREGSEVSSADANSNRPSGQPKNHAS